MVDFSVLAKPIYAFMVLKVPAFKPKLNKTTIAPADTLRSTANAFLRKRFVLTTRFGFACRFVRLDFTPCTSGNSLVVRFIFTSLQAGIYPDFLACQQREERNLELRCAKRNGAVRMSGATGISVSGTQ